MGLLRSLLLLPVKAPMDGAMWIVQKIHGAAEEEMNNPATIKKTLVQLENALLRGEITEDEYDIAETDLLMRLRAVS